MESAKFDLHLIDYAIVVAYFIGVVAHGIYVSRKQSGGSEDYFLAGRSLPWYLIGFSLFASKYQNPNSNKTENQQTICPLLELMDLAESAVMSLEQ